jgi:glucokinase-like ROK family protein
VLQLLRKQGPLAKIQIARELAISPALVGLICNEFMQAGIITVAGTGESAGGRRPTLLRLNERSSFAIGCDVGVTHITSVLADLHGRVIERCWVSTDPRDDAATTLRHIHDSIQEVIGKAGLPMGSILGIGLSVPGLIDLANGVSVLAPNLPNWRQVPVVKLVEEAFGAPVFIINDAWALALGEHWFGAGRGHRDLVAVNIGIGIGAGIILDGRLYQGGIGGCGEIGHVTVNENGPRCPCGSNGCLELMASGPAISARAVQAISSAVPTALETLADGYPLKVSAQSVAEAAKQGDKVATEILADAGRYVGIGVAMVVNLLSPGMVILGGGVARSGAAFFEAVRSTVDRRAYTTIVNKPEIVLSELEDDASVLGAAALVLEKAFHSAGSLVAASA